MHSGYFEGIASLVYLTAAIRGMRAVVVICSTGAKMHFANACLTTRKQVRASQNRSTIPHSQLETSLVHSTTTESLKRIIQILEFDAFAYQES